MNGIMPGITLVPRAIAGSCCSRACAGVTSVLLRSATAPWTNQITRIKIHRKHIPLSTTLLHCWSDAYTSRFPTVSLCRDPEIYFMQPAGHTPRNYNHLVYTINSGRRISPKMFFFFFDVLLNNFWWNGQLSANWDSQRKPNNMMKHLWKIKVNVQTPCGQCYVDIVNR